MATVKLRHFDKYQKMYLIVCIVKGLSTKKIVSNFQQVFPDFGAELDKKTLANKLSRRISDIKRKNADEIQAYSCVFGKYTLFCIPADIPLMYTEVRQRVFQELLEDPEYSRKSSIIKEIKRDQKDPMWSLTDTMERLIVAVERQLKENAAVGTAAG